MPKTKKGKTSEGKPGKKNDLASMFGLTMPEDDDDEDLEAELLALTGKPAKKSKGKNASLAEIQAMAAEGLRDVDEDELSDADLDDDDLLSELVDLAEENEEDENEEDEDEDEKEVASTSAVSSAAASGLVEVIEERKALYERGFAEAKANGENSKVRRFGRSLQTCDELLKAAKKGRPVNESDLPPAIRLSGNAREEVRTVPEVLLPELPELIPAPKKPEVAVTAPKPAPRPRPKPTAGTVVPPVPAKRPSVPLPISKSSLVPEKMEVIPSSSEVATSSDGGEMKEENEMLVAVVEMLSERQNQYKKAALQAKQSGDSNSAVGLMKTAKYFEMTVTAIRKEEEVNLSQIPPAPQGFQSSAKCQSTIEMLQQMSPEGERPAHAQTPQSSSSKVPEMPPPIAGSILEGLEQRFAKYEQAVNIAKEEGQSSKVRRMGRIVSQYKEAIKACKAKKAYDYSELPIPPGYPPLPSASQRSPVAAPAVVPAAVESVRLAKTSSPPQPQHPTTPQMFPAPRSASDEQMDFLAERQKALKSAALQAKQHGNIDLAKEIFRQAKSMDQMIEAAQGGIKVDMSQVPPLSPAAADVTGEAAPELTVSSERTEEDEELFARLEKNLKNQQEMAELMGNYYNGLGHIQEVAEYRKMAATCQRDLDAVKNARTHKKPVPRFHYEERTFPKLRVFPELSDGEAEVVIVRGVNLPPLKGYEAKDMDTYVAVEFPYPQDDPPKAKTSVAKGSVNPTYDQSFKFPIDRKQRAFGRVLKRRTVQVEVWLSRGFFHSDKLIGEAAVKIEDLETKSEVHECADLTLNRKAVGGKLEVRVRMRQPLQGEDIEIVSDRWTIIDHPASSLNVSPRHRSPSPRRASAPESRTPLYGPPVAGIVSYRVAQTELQAAEKLAKELKSQRKMTPKPVDSRIRECKEKMATIQSKMKQGGKAYIIAYVKMLARKVTEEHALAAQLVKAGSRSEAAAALQRKKIMENEIGEWKTKFNL
eukprot:m.310443 g.310443  ORF g.310443 m.310443 type:complete len:987 (+) comp51652_c0_seq1:29-2989(+)